MSDAPIVGSAAFELRATKQKLGEDIKAAERDLKAAMGQVEQDAERSSKNTGSSMNRMTRGIALGFTALAATFTAGLAMALKFGQASLKMADDLANSSRRIGISSTALQEWQHVARRTGEDANAVGGALESFGVKLAQAGAGLSKEAADTFRALGFTPDQLRSFKDVESALDAVTDRIGELGSASDRAAIAEKLGLGPLATALREGSDEVSRLRDEAAALGFVLDEELVKKGATAQGQLEDLSQVIGIQMASAFINLSDEVLAFTGHIAEAIKKLNEFSGKYTEARQQMVDEGVENPNWASVLGRANEQPWVKHLPWVKARRSGFPDAMREARANPSYEDPDDPAFLWGMDAGERRRRFGQTLPSGRDRLTPVQPKGRSSNDRSEEREQRRAERVEQEIFRLRQRALGIADDELMTVQERFDLAKKQVEMEREAEAKELESRLARKDITAEEYSQLKLIQSQTATLEDRVSSEILARDLADERLAKERALTDLTADLLSLQSSAARTAKERREIELRLLAMAQSRAREDLETELSRTPGLTDADKQARRDALGQVQAAQAAAVNRQNMSPLEAWRDQSLKTADEIAEAYESIAARGLDALNDGIVDAIMNSKDLGETFSQVARQILADLLSISVRRGITEPLVNALFGGNGSGAGRVASSTNWLSKALSAGRSFLGFDKGGYTGDGGVQEPAGIVHKGEYVFSAEAVRRIGAARLETMHANLKGFSAGGLVGMSLPSLSIPGMSGGAGSQRVIHEVVVRPERDSFIALASNAAAPVAAQASEAAFTGARQAVPSDMARTSRYTRGR
ncbi:hypothetical protein D3C73_08080 [compost metagenome]